MVRITDASPGAHFRTMSPLLTTEVSLVYSLMPKRYRMRTLGRLLERMTLGDVEPQRALELCCLLIIVNLAKGKE
jgi:hypothetical protein